LEALVRPQGNRDLLRLDRPIHFVVVRWDPVRQLRRYVGEGRGGPGIIQWGKSAFRGSVPFGGGFESAVSVGGSRPLDDLPEHPGENTVDWRRVLHRPFGVARDTEEDDNTGEALTVSDRRPALFTDRNQRRGGGPRATYRPPAEKIGDRE